MATAQNQIPDGLTLPDKTGKDLNEIMNQLVLTQHEVVSALRNFGGIGSNDTLIQSMVDQFKKAQEEGKKKEPEAPSKKPIGSRAILGKLGGQVEKHADSITDILLGPMQLLTKPIEDKTGKKMSGLLRAGAAGLLKRNSPAPSEEEEKKPPQVPGGADFPTNLPQLLGAPAQPINLETTDRMLPKKSNLLAKGGLIGAGFVYLGEVFQGKDPEKGGSGIGAELIDDLLPIQSMKKMIGKALPIVGAMLPAVAGVAIAGLLKRNDFADAMSQWQDGDRLKAVESLLIGSRDRVDESKGGQPSKEMARQAGAWGAGALGIATTAGTMSAMAGGAGFTAALGTAAVAALPITAIVAGVAGLAKGIQAAWVNSWDSRAEDVTAQTKNILQDDEASWWDKTRALVGWFGKAFFGSLVGGIKAVGAGFMKRVQKTKDLWGSDSTIFDKIMGTIRELNPFSIIDGAVRDMWSGIGSVMGKYMKAMLPERFVNVIVNVWDGIEGLTSKLIKKITSAGGAVVRKAKEAIGGFFGRTFENIGNTLSTTFTTTKEAITNASWFITAQTAVQNAVGFLGNIFTNAKNAVKDYVDDVIVGMQSAPWMVTFRETVNKITSFFGDIFAKISGFVNDMTGAAEALVSDLMVNGKFEFESLALNDDEKVALDSYIQTNFDGSRKDFLDSYKASGLDGVFKGFGALMDKSGEINAGKAKKLEEHRVEDAIITKDGKIIHTNQDDNLIATKNEPRFLQNEMSPSPTVPGSGDQGAAQEMIKQLREIVTVLKDKEFQNIAVGGGNNTSSRDSILAAQLNRG